MYFFSVLSPGAWGTNLTNVLTVDTSLIVGIDGGVFVNAAEIVAYFYVYLQLQIITHCVKTAEA